MTKGQAIRKYRQAHRRLDYYPSPDVERIIDQHLASGLDTAIAGVIDTLVREGNKAISGKPNRVGNL